MTSCFSSICSIQTTLPRSRRTRSTRLELAGDLGRVRSAGREHDLRAWVDRQGGLGKVDDALLACDAADEDHERLPRPHAVALQHVGARIRAVLLAVDAVEDD